MFDHVAQGIAKNRRNLEHRRCLEDRRIAIFGRLAAFIHQADNGLRRGKVAADSNVITRSPGTSQLFIFLTWEISSTPALVRVSDMNTSPLLS